MLAITGFQLNIMTANLSAIAIGVGVDYSIHLISGIYYYRREGMDRQESLQAALDVLTLSNDDSWLVLGDMGELGVSAAELHAAAGRQARTAGVTRLYGLG